MKYRLERNASVDTQISDWHVSTEGNTSTYTEGGWKGLVHTVWLCGLETSASYEYSVGDPSEVFGDTYSFVSAAPLGSKRDVRLVVYGDMGTPCPAPECYGVGSWCCVSQFCGSRRFLTGTFKVHYRLHEPFSGKQESSVGWGAPRWGYSL